MTSGTVSRKMVATRICFWLACLIEALCILYQELPSQSHEPRHGLLIAISVVFLLFYLLPFAAFGAGLRDESDGLHVEQYTSTIIPYTQIKTCFGLFLIPFQVVIVLTESRFPLNILISGDVFAGGKNGLFRDGKQAAKIKQILSPNLK
jgi:hypothetical protein